MKETGKEDKIHQEKIRKDKKNAHVNGQQIFVINTQLLLSMMYV